MQTNLTSIIVGGLVQLGLCALGIYLLILAIQTMRLYIKSHTVRQEKAETTRSLGEVLKKHRAECKMTQEFVAEALFVSRQAVSKWEGGLSDPNTSNLVALAKLYGVTPEALLRETRGAAAGDTPKAE